LHVRAATRPSLREPSSGVTARAMVNVLRGRSAAAQLE
jgi:hypothetical protein